MREKIAKLIDVKSIVTLLFAFALVVLLFTGTKVSGELMTLFCTAFGSIITYFFTKKSNSESEDKK